MNYTLMHKNRAVLDLEIDEASGAIVKAGIPFEMRHLPVGIATINGYADRGALNYWWQERAIPASRSGIREALEALSIYSPQLLLTKCLGLSLSDQYWVRPLGSGLLWEQVNFFDNPFSDDIGDVLLGKRRQAETFDFSSPDNTSDGSLKKRWKIIDGTRCLIKGGSGVFQQQPFNEVIASAVMERLGVDHVPYRLYWDGETPYCLCPDFVTRDTELVSAWRIMQTERRRNEISVYQHYCNCCAALGVDVVPALDRMIVTDYIIANEDRHLGNFGLIRNADTLEWLSVAPVFDSGSSLGYNQATPEIRAGEEIRSRPFRVHPDEQLALVSSLDWLDFGKLAGLKEEAMEILDSAGMRLDSERREAIVTAMTARVQRLEEYALTRQRSFFQCLSQASRIAEERNLHRAKPQIDLQTPER